MKLKKIASLALAGIMAVSMLAGCGEGISNSGSSSSETTNPSTGVSATLYKELSDATKSKIKFNDSAELNSVLAKNVGSVGYDLLADIYDNTDYKSVKYIEVNTGATGVLNNVGRNMIADLEAANTNNINMAGAIGELNPTAGNQDEKSVNVVLLFAVNNGVDTNNALAAVAKMIDNDVKALKVDNDEVNNNASELRYTYTGSVSATTKVDSNNHGKGMTFIAVELVRTLG